MTQKEEAIRKARELAVEYQATLVGCGHCSFAATVDALRSVGIELVDERLENEMFKGLMGLTGGIGNMGYGTCGALSGAGFAVSIAAGVGRTQGTGQRQAESMDPLLSREEGPGTEVAGPVSRVVLQGDPGQELRKGLELQDARNEQRAL
jgi:hypothetical protein